MSAESAVEQIGNGNGRLEHLNAHVGVNPSPSHAFEYHRGNRFNPSMVLPENTYTLDAQVVSETLAPRLPMASTDMSGTTDVWKDYIIKPYQFNNLSLLRSIYISLTGSHDVASTTYYPTPLWIQRFEVFSGPRLVQTVSGTENMLMWAKRVSPADLAIGKYATANDLGAQKAGNVTSETGVANGADNEWWIPLMGFWNDNGLHLPSLDEDLRIRVYFEKQSRNIDTSGTVTAFSVAEISGCGDLHLSGYALTDAENMAIRKEYGWTWTSNGQPGSSIGTPGTGRWTRNPSKFVDFRISHCKEQLHTQTLSANSTYSLTLNQREGVMYGAAIVFVRQTAAIGSTDLSTYVFSGVTDAAGVDIRRANGRSLNDDVTITPSNRNHFVNKYANGWVFDTTNGMQAAAVFPFAANANLTSAGSMTGFEVIERDDYLWLDMGSTAGAEAVIILEEYGHVRIQGGRIQSTLI